MDSIKTGVIATGTYPAEINLTRFAQIEERLLAEIGEEPWKAAGICNYLSYRGIKDGSSSIAYEGGKANFNYMASDLPMALMIARYFAGKAYLEGGHGEVDQAAKYFEAAADTGCPRSLTELHKLYIDGRGAKRWNFPRALNYLKQEADSGKRDAAYRLSVLYKEGVLDVDSQGYEIGTLLEANSKSASFYLKMAADQYHPEALYLLGLHVEKYGVTEGLLSAEAYFNLASDANQLIFEKAHVDAQRSLEKMYFQGNGIRSLAYLIDADTKGDPAAKFRLGEFYAQGKIVERDVEKAKEFFKKAAEAKFPEALYQLGTLYLNGDASMRITKDQPLAMNCLKEAAELNHANAAFEYGMELLKQRGQFDDEILKYLKIADANGNSDASYQLYVFYAQNFDQYKEAKRVVEEGFMPQVAAGTMKWNEYLNRMDLWRQSLAYPQSRDVEAERYFQKALEQEHPEALFQNGKSSLNAADRYRDDLKQAISNLEKAANKGHAEAAFLLAKYNLDLLPTTRSKHTGIVQREIFNWLKIATSKGFPAALYLLGQLHSDEQYYAFKISNEVERQLTIESCFKKAADQGHAGAAFALAEMYAKRSWSWSMTPPFLDPREEATKYYKIAAEHGHPLAQKSVPIPPTLNTVELLATATYGCPDALYQDAMLKFSQKESSLAEQQLAKAAKAGHPAAIVKQGMVAYDRGQALESRSFSLKNPLVDNQAKAIPCYVEAANLGNLNAAMRLGEIHESRIGFFSPSPEEITKAKVYYRMAGDLGNAALTRLNNLYPSTQQQVIN